MNELENFYGPNAGYVLELYERYQQNPASVDAATRAIFDKWSPELASVGSGQDNRTPLAKEQVGGGRGKGETLFEVDKVVAAAALAHAIRERGHLGAHLDPLGSEPLGDPALLPETHGISDADLTALVLKQQVELDEGKRLQEVYDVQRAHADKMYYPPIIYTKAYTFEQPWVQNFFVVDNYNFGTEQVANMSVNNR